MGDSSYAVKDSLAMFREYMRLERRRSSGLSPAELQRWEVLRQRMKSVFGDLDSPNHSERRATPRIPTALQVRFENHAEVGNVLMTNISRGGIFVPLDTPIEIGTEIKLRIQIVDPPRELALVGEVASCCVGPGMVLGQRGVGIHFKKLSPSEKALFDELYEQQVERQLSPE
jgi:Tfp pilus assembly protein PilZ